MKKKDLLSLLGEHGTVKYRYLTGQHIGEHWSGHKGIILSRDRAGRENTNICLKSLSLTVSFSLQGTEHTLLQL